MSSSYMCVVHGWVTLILVYMWSSNVALFGVMHVRCLMIGIPNPNKKSFE